MFHKRGDILHIEYIDSVRPWTALLPHTFKTVGAYSKRTVDDPLEVPHSYTYLTRSCPQLKFCIKPCISGGEVNYILTFPHCLSGMPLSLLQKAAQRLPPDTPAHDLDVFLLMKARMSSPDLCQNPLLIQPGHGILTEIETSLNALQTHHGTKDQYRVLKYGLGGFTTLRTPDKGLKDFTYSSQVTSRRLTRKDLKACLAWQSFWIHILNLVGQPGTCASKLALFPNIGKGHLP